MNSMEDEEINEAIHMLDSLSLTNEESHPISKPRCDFKIIKLLIKIKRGNHNALHQLEVQAREFSERSLFHIAFLLSHHILQLSFEERRNLQEIFDILLPLIGDDIVRANACFIIQILTPKLTSSDPTDNEIGRNIVSSLASFVGLDFMNELGQEDISSFREQCRLRGVQIFIALASSSGISSLLPIIANLCSISSPGNVREAGFKIIQQIAMLNGHAMIPHLSELVSILSLEIRAPGTNAWTMCSGALAIESLAQAVHPHGKESLFVFVPRIFKCMKENLLPRRWMVAYGACAKAIGSIVGQLEKPMKDIYTKDLVEMLVSQLFVKDSMDEEMGGVMMTVFKKCVDAGGVSYLDIICCVGNECVLKSFLAKNKELNLNNCRIMLAVTMEIAKKIGVEKASQRAIIMEIKEGSLDYLQLVMEIVTEANAYAKSLNKAALEGLVQHQFFSAPLS